MKPMLKRPDGPRYKNAIDGVIVGGVVGPWLHSLYKFVSSIKPLIFGLNQKGGICIYMYIVHIKMTLHIQVFV